MSEVVARTGGAAALGAGVLIVGQEIWVVAAGGVREGVAESAVHCAWLLLMLFGALGIREVQRAHAGRLGEVATLVLVLGITLFLAPSLGEVLTPVPPGAEEAPGAAWVMPVLFSIIGLYVGGIVLFAVASWRAHVLPRGATGLLLASVPLGAVGGAVVLGALLPMGVAWAWMGAATLAAVSRRRRSVAGLVPAPAPAV